MQIRRLPKRHPPTRIQPFEMMGPMRSVRSNTYRRVLTHRNNRKNENAYQSKIKIELDRKNAAVYFSPRGVNIYSLAVYKRNIKNMYNNKNNMCNRNNRNSWNNKNNQVGIVNLNGSRAVPVYKGTIWSKTPTVTFLV